MPNIYRITETIRIMIFVVLAMLVFNFYPITAIMIILLAFLNDVPIMTIAYDRTYLDPKPVRWNMHRIIVVSTVMGLTGVIGSFLMLYLAINWLHLTVPQIQTYIFLTLVVAGHLTLFVARNKGFFQEALSRTDHDLDGNRHQATRDPSGSVWLWSHYTDKLDGYCPGLGICHYRSFFYGLGQSHCLSSFCHGGFTP